MAKQKRNHNEYGLIKKEYYGFIVLVLALLVMVLIALPIRNYHNYEYCGHITAVSADDDGNLLLTVEYRDGDRSLTADNESAYFILNGKSKIKYCYNEEDKISAGDAVEIITASKQNGEYHVIKSIYVYAPGIYPESDS